MVPNLEGKIALITGATEGIGRVTATELSRAGATLVIVGRNRDKTERFAAELRAHSPPRAVEALVADLSTFAGVRSVGEAFRARHERLDLLLNNAGALFLERRLTVDGLESTFALNHMAYFVLTNSLHDILTRTPGARIVNTASDAHLQGRIDLEDIAKREKGYSGWGAYRDSKLANVLFTRELARRNACPTALAVHPGWVNTGFGLGNRGVIALGIRVLAPLFARTPERGAETLIWASTSAEASRLNGEYLFDCAVGHSSDRSRDPDMARRLWEFSSRLAEAAGGT